MRYAVYAPWLLSSVLALPAVTATLRRLPDRVDPRPVLVLLTISMAAAAVATTASLVMLVAVGVAQLGQASPLTSPSGHAAPGAVPVGVTAAVALAVVLVRTVRECRGRRRRRRRVHDALRSSGRPEDGVALIDDGRVFAVAAPGWRRCPRRVVVSRGLVEALDRGEYDAVVAHEREHLDRGHHRHLAVAGLAVALNPLLRPWWEELVYTAERCADEGAARRMADRELVGRAVGRAALSARTSHARPVASAFPASSLALGVTTGPVPRRVAALLAGDDRGSGVVPALLVAVVVLALAALAAAGAVHAAWDLGDLFGTAPVG
ncbi:hypothetical protein Acsp06_60290 [Actinomycetospora sp. NBRC 106375]|uniref:M56 family metallopeptidase n=1 Tax=Actinomycetospora sp. NBRC 106375 TaxID=3032207 RepID=UPI0024A5D033|nr:M56 family metallopeptidase [Actinomycetospora sp. NBRC 106375]GLZ49844.1 hypothetical protein Acsp06_60290 [Actinomycetospora sp. NBRC 106375]